MRYALLLTLGCLLPAAPARAADDPAKQAVEKM